MLRIHGHGGIANHEYLRRKHVKSHGLKIEDGCLLVPLRDIDGKLWSLLKILPDGFKLNQEFARASECFFTIGDIGSSDTFCICEGYATAATIYDATGFPTVSACYAGNLENVAPLLRNRHPNATIYICGVMTSLTKNERASRTTTLARSRRHERRRRSAASSPCRSSLPAQPRDGLPTSTTHTCRFGGLDKNGREDGLAKSGNAEAARKDYDAAQAGYCTRGPAGCHRGDPPPASSPEDTGDEEADDSDTDTDDSISGDADTEALRAAGGNQERELNAAIDNLNKKYCVVSDSGSVFIFSDRYERELGRRIYDRMTKTGFMMLLESKPPICTSISGEGKRSAKPIAKVWLTSEEPPHL
jgi:hypothetical protein